MDDANNPKIRFVKETQGWIRVSASNNGKHIVLTRQNNARTKMQIISIMTPSMALALQAAIADLIAEMGNE